MGRFTTFYLLIQITYIIIIILLLSSDLYNKKQITTSDGKTTETLDFESFKVLAAMGIHCFCALCISACMVANNIPKISRVFPPIGILTILVFNFIFNVIGSIILWVHKLPRSELGHSRLIRGAAVLSSVASVYTILIGFVYCYRYPAHPSLKLLQSRGGETGRKDEVSKEKQSSKVGAHAEKDVGGGSNHGSNDLKPLDEEEKQKHPPRKLPSVVKMGSEAMEKKPKGESPFGSKEDGEKRPKRSETPEISKESAQKKSSAELDKEMRKKTSAEPVRERQRNSSGEPVKERSRKSFAEPVKERQRTSIGEPVKERSRKSYEMPPPPEEIQRRPPAQQVREKSRRSSVEPGIAPSGEAMKENLFPKPPGGSPKVVSSTKTAIPDPFNLPEDEHAD